jgi:NAD(P)H dehydrogenase (quinone)
MTESTLFVSGASGKMGRRVVELLLERRYPGRIIAGSRTPETLVGFDGVEARKADYDDKDGYVAALAGVDRVLLISHEFADEKRLGRHLNAVAAAKSAGVKHIVYTSMPNPEPPSPIPFAGDHFGAEQAIKETGIGYTLLRNVWYAENLLGSLPPVLQSGKWFSATGEGKIAHATREDEARAAAGALVLGGPSRTLTVTGPEALTTRQIAAIASEVTGKPIEVIDVTDEQLVAGLLQAGLPAPIAHLIASFDKNTRLGRIDMVTDTVEQLWGTKPASVRAFLEANRSALG